MKIYIDLVLLLNFVFDFLLLISVSILLKRNVLIIRIILGALVGSLSILFLFIKLTSLQLFLLKILISILMVIITFKYNNLKYTLRNLGYLYMMSVVLGGFLYLLNLEFSYKQIGMVFYHNGLSINFIFLIIFSPIILYIYIKQGIKLKHNYNNYYKVIIYLEKETIKCIGYLDSGNNLKRFNRPVVLLNKKEIKHNYNYIFIPYQSSSQISVLKCIKGIIEINNKKQKILVGIMENEISIDGVGCLLNNKLRGDIIDN